MTNIRAWFNFNTHFLFVYFIIFKFKKIGNPCPHSHWLLYKYMGHKQTKKSYWFKKGLKSRDTVPLKKQDPLNKCKILTSSLKSLGNFFQKVVLRSQETFWSCVCWQIGKVLQIELSNFGPANNGIIHNNNNNSKKLANVWVAKRPT